jgi:hypothetical protein
MAVAQAGDVLRKMSKMPFKQLSPIAILSVILLAHMVHEFSNM